MLSASGGVHGRRSYLLAACVVGLALAWPQWALARSARPFASLAGEWRGVGTATGADGHSERITCRANNTVSEDASNLSQSLVCASDSYRFDIRTDISTDGRMVRGRWEESTRNASGGLSGEIDGDSILGTVEAPNFTADISITTTGNRQRVTILPKGADVVRVEIGLRRAG